MTTHDLHDFIIRTIPGAVGTALYALTELGPVAWITFVWVLIQITRFCIQWYREERDFRRAYQRAQDAADKAEEDYP